MWQLIEVQKTDWIQDDSGYYTLINWINDNTVRLDWIYSNDMPVVSFQGVANDVRKCAMRFAQTIMDWDISYEHAAYIGYELARCELLKKDYVQD